MPIFFDLSVVDSSANPTAATTNHILHFLNSLINIPTHFILNAHLNNFWTLIVGLGWLYLIAVSACAIVIVGMTLLRRLPLFVARIAGRLSRNTAVVSDAFLELAFPADTTKSAYATEQLHLLLRGQVRYRSYLDKLAGYRQPYSLELVGTKDDGIRYVLVIPSEQVEYISHNLLSFMPGLKIRQVQDYMKSLAPHTMIGIVELKLGAEFAYPLRDHKALEEHDPIAFFAGHMTKLLSNELAAIQVVVTPVTRSTHFRVTQRARRIRAVIGRGEMLTPELNKKLFGMPRIVWICLLLPLWIVGTLLKIAVAMVALFADHRRSDIPFFDSYKNKRGTGDLYEQELAGIVKAKLSQQLFEVSIRILVASPDDATIGHRLDALTSTFRMFGSPYQHITQRRSIPLFGKLQNWQADRLQTKFRERKLTPNTFSYGTILSSSELSDLYHFPNTDMVKTEGFVKSRSRELAAPLSIKRSNAKLDVIVGVNKHGGEDQPIGVTLSQREKHTYVIGKTGTGKTTLLKSTIYQDMLSGKGLAVLDPHGDMFKELLSIVPEHRLKDVIVFNPADWDFPIGLNLLDPGIPFGTEREKHQRITSNVLAVFAKLADEKQWGPRMEHILRSTTMTALQLPNPNLYILQRLLTEKKYQREVAKTLKDPVLKQFWDKEFKLLGTMQLSNVTAPLTHRLGHFITSVMSRHILLQQDSTIRISEIMDEGKILLVNLSKGDIGQDESLFFGTILTSFIWMAAYQRNRIPEEERKDFFLYVDEFQNFATPEFSEIGSEGRKYHVPLIVSHQNIAQIEDKNLLKSVVGNAHTIICLKASPDDEAFILPYMAPVVEKGDIVNLTPHHFFMKTTADESEDAFSGVTVPLDVEGSDEMRDAVIAASRQQYATPVNEVEKYMEKLFGVEETKKHKQQKSTRKNKNDGKNSAGRNKSDDKNKGDSEKMIEG